MSFLYTTLTSNYQPVTLAIKSMRPFRKPESISPQNVPPALFIVPLFLKYRDLDSKVLLPTLKFSRILTENLKTHTNTPLPLIQQLMEWWAECLVIFFSTCVMRRSPLALKSSQNNWPKASHTEKNGRVLNHSLDR